MTMALNVKLCKYIHHTPPNIAAGGVSIYVKANLTSKKDDLSFCNNDFDTIWIEIENSITKNVLCRTYCHPSTGV